MVEVCCPETKLEAAHPHNAHHNHHCYHLYNDQNLSHPATTLEIAPEARSAPAMLSANRVQGIPMDDDDHFTEDESEDGDDNEDEDDDVIQQCAK